MALFHCRLDAEQFLAVLELEICSDLEFMMYIYIHMYLNIHLFIHLYFSYHFYSFVIYHYSFYHSFI